MRHMVALLALAVAAVPGIASAWELGAKGAYWIAELSSGQIRLDDGGEGTEVDLHDDLGIDSENLFFGEAWLWAGRHHLSLTGTPVDYSGSERIGTSIEFGGVSFPANTRVDTSLEYVVLDLAYQYDLIDIENILAGLSLGPVFRVSYFDGEVKMKGGGEEESQSFRIPFPMLGLGGHLGIVADLLEVRARAAGMWFRGDFVVEALGEVSLNPLTFIELVGGYRYFRIDIDEEDLLLDYTQTGPYVGLSLKI